MLEKNIMLHQATNRKAVDTKPAYAAPTMVIYGSVGELTAGGSGSTSEGGAQPNCNNNGATKQRC